jgi:DNA-directed RNA polymerase specialized sigma24 family protein
MGDDHDGSAPSTITHWTLIVRAQGTGEDATKALGELLVHYHRFVVRLMQLSRCPPDTSPEELYQEYVLGIVRRRDIEKLVKHGSLRGFISASVRSFMLNEHDRWLRRRRTETRPLEPYTLATPEDAVIDAAFIANLVTNALELSRSRSRRPERFDALARFLPGPQADPVQIAPLAAELGMSTVGLKKAIFDERRRFERCLDELLLDTLDLGGDTGDPERVAARLRQEKKELGATLESPGQGVILDRPEDPA